MQTCKHLYKNQHKMATDFGLGSCLQTLEVTTKNGCNFHCIHNAKITI